MYVKHKFGAKFDYYECQAVTVVVHVVSVQSFQFQEEWLREKENECVCVCGCACVRVTMKLRDVNTISINACREPYRETFHQYIK